MTTPSPIPPTNEHVYQPSESSDHSLLSHSHSCLCPNEHAESPTPTDHCHTPNKVLSHSHHTGQGHSHLNVINQLSHGPTNQNHSHPVHVHASIHASPKSNSRHNNQSKNGSGAPCACHLQTGSETVPPEIHEANIVQNRKLDADDSIEVSPLPPALPPRPPPRQRPFDGMSGGSFRTTNFREGGGGASHGGIRKYVFWCSACGGMSTLIGALFLAVYFMLRTYTSTLSYFETIPTFVPATMLILTGLCVMSLARRKNRFSYLIKMSGVCCLVCALICVLVTITTTVIHMNRLQTLRECVYTQKTRTCTCYSVVLQAHTDSSEDTKFVFDSTPDCEVIHGALYSCLRAMFGLSVSGILVCIFSCMLIYQLLSHERKKMYWEQLELRCRSLYQHQTTSGTMAGSMRGPPVSLSAGTAFCSCCEECRYTPIQTLPHQLYPWDAHALDRFWTPGQVGNFYSPNPGEEIASTQTGMSSATTVNGNNPRERDSRSGGWSWRRLPWTRGCPDVQRTGSTMSYPATISSPDSQYGFSSAPVGGSAVTNATPTVEQLSSSGGGYSVLTDRPVGGTYLWGPPPPYSNPDSPARRGVSSPARYHHAHHHVHHPHSHSTHCQLSDENQSHSSIPSECQHRLRNRLPVAHFTTKDNYENTTEPEIHQISNDSSENTDNSNSDRVSNTLPIRKTKKRIDISSVKSVTNGQNFRANIQNVFNAQNFDENSEATNSEEHSYQEPTLKVDPKSVESSGQKCRFLPRLQGVENPAFQNQENNQPQQQMQKNAEATESEVYFADVSSCCNISVRNDGQDSSLYDEAVETVQKPRLMSLQCITKSDNENANKLIQNFQDNIGSSLTVTEDEDYLAHRMGKRQLSTRSRLPFPLPSSDDNELTINSDACIQLLPKDISQNSLCSSIQTPLTETTDDAVSPISQSFPNSECCMNFYPENSNNIDTKNPKHRTFSNTNLENQFLAPDAQYEVIQQSSGNQNYQRHFNDVSSSASKNNNSGSNLTNTISELSSFCNQSFGNQNFNNIQNFSGSSNVNFNNTNKTFQSANQNFNNSLINQNIGNNNQSFNNSTAFTADVNYNQNTTKNIPPKTLNVSQNNSPRKNIGSNISTLIQNLGSNPVGLLYGEATSAEEEDIQAQTCHSDATMDSGWQSGSERQDSGRGDSSEESGQRSVNV